MNTKEFETDYRVPEQALPKGQDQSSMLTESHPG
jgi:hypothetical protein